ncbi:MAG: recombination protein RecR [Clostridia bacterium]|nr:recombination protein RecR [Clostridia bacterium]MBR3845877.1 recombination protein RecR [Clostridia bacterium]
MAEHIEALQRLAEQFARLPGIGKKSAMRLAFSILELSDEEAESFANTIIEAKEKVHLCPVCQSLTDKDVCSVCNDLSRDRGTIMVLEDTKAVSSLEKVREYRGTYHVLHGVISPMNGVTPDKLKIRELLARVATDEVREIIIATNPTVEGEATAMYLSKLLKPFEIKVSRLAYGIPVGSDLEYADEVTLYRAIEGRRDI